MFTRLANAADWDAYTSQMCLKLGVSPVRVRWGKGPREYPCLVTTIAPQTPGVGDQQMISAYVYRSDARQLCEEVPLVRAVLPPADPCAQPTPACLPAVVPPAETELKAAVATIAYFLLETSIVKPEVYAGRLDHLRRVLAGTEQAEPGEAAALVAAGL